MATVSASPVWPSAPAGTWCKVGSRTFTTVWAVTWTMTRPPSTAPVCTAVTLK